MTYFVITRKKYAVLTRKGVVLTRKDVVFNEKRSRYNEKRCCFNEKRCCYNDIIEWKKYYVCGSNASPYLIVMGSSDYFTDSDL